MLVHASKYQQLSIAVSSLIVVPLRIQNTNFIYSRKSYKLLMFFFSDLEIKSLRIRLRWWADNGSL